MKMHHPSGLGISVFTCCHLSIATTCTCQHGCYCNNQCMNENSVCLDLKLIHGIKTFLFILIIFSQKLFQTQIFVIASDIFIQTHKTTEVNFALPVDHQTIFISSSVMCTFRGQSDPSFFPACVIIHLNCIQRTLSLFAMYMYINQ